MGVPVREVGLGSRTCHRGQLAHGDFRTHGLFVGRCDLAVTRGEKLKCACMGTAFNLPMNTVTIVEDLGMAAMAAVMWMQSSPL